MLYTDYDHLFLNTYILYLNIVQEIYWVFEWQEEGRQEQE